MSPYLLASEARATLEMSTSRVGRAGPMMLSLRLNTDREQDALRASVLPRRPAGHTEVHDNDEDRAADFPGQQRFHMVEIPIPHSDPYRVAAVLSVDSIAAIDALRALLDDAETALAERYPVDQAADESPAADRSSVAAWSGPDAGHAELDPWGELSAPATPAPAPSPKPSPIRPTPEQLEEARELVRGGTGAPRPISVAEATANYLGRSMLQIAQAHAGCWRGERCGICRELGSALALFQVSKEKEFTGAEGGEPA